MNDELRTIIKAFGKLASEMAKLERQAELAVYKADLAAAQPELPLPSPKKP